MTALATTLDTSFFVVPSMTVPPMQANYSVTHQVQNAQHSLNTLIAVYVPVPQTDVFALMKGLCDIICHIMSGLQGPIEQTHTEVCTYKAQLNDFFKASDPANPSFLKAGQKKHIQCAELIGNHHAELTRIMDSCTHANIYAVDFDILQESAVRLACLRDNLLLQNDPDWIAMHEYIRNISPDNVALSVL